MLQQVVLKSENSLILTAPVMIPNTPDCDYYRGEKLFSTDEIRAFKEAYDNFGFIDKYHSVYDVTVANKSKLVANALKSFLLDSDTTYQLLDGTMQTYPEGTWMLTSEITDPTTIKQVNDGYITGYSPSIFNQQQAEQIGAALKQSAGGLIRDITNPTPVLVSLVHKPCQHKSKFCKTNQMEGENMSEDNAQSTLDKVKEVLGMSGTNSDPQYALKSDLDSLKESFDASLKSDKEELKDFITETVNTCIKDALSKPGLKEDNTKKEEDNQEEEKPPKEESSEEDSETPKEDKEKEDDDEKPGLKSKKINDSKSLPQTGTTQKPALKSDKAIVMEVMGRDIKGRPLKKQ